jgi:asparagine synthase (glutamine-hydrolysing)
MSAICGLVDERKRMDLTAKGALMMKCFDNYKLDREDSIYKNGVFFGNGLQIFTKEANNEILPYYDEEEKLLITADAVIDNREELIRQLKIDIKVGEIISDSQLILEAYKKWRHSCTEHLIGDFAFAIWEELTKELFLVRDHVGKRSLYYYQNNDFIAFCTTMKPIIEAFEETKELNDRWISDFLTIEGPVSAININETVRKYIFQIPPGHCAVYKDKDLMVTQYWFPEHIKVLKGKSDEQYYENFGIIFNEAVKCRLRSSGNIGVMLSGGLDSTSVAAIAAIELEKSGESIEAFTSIPLVEFNNFLSQSHIPDESEYIYEMKNKFNNINLNFCRCEDKNSYLDIDENLEVLEEPYKMVDNLYWINEIVNNAESKGCKVLLDGQFGNFTISYGNFLTHIYTLFKKFRFISFNKEIKEYSSFYGIEVIKVYKVVVKRILQGILESLPLKKREESLDDEMKIVNKDLCHKFDSLNRTKRMGYNNEDCRLLDLNDMRRYVTNLVLFSHMGSIETKKSLEKGIIKRDPTRDKRIVEFCLSVPGEVFVSKGKERNLIRSSMEAILPEKIRLNYTRRGKQSADWVQRLVPHWRDIRSEGNKLIDDGELNRYIDDEKFKGKLSALGDDLDYETYGFELKSVLITIIFSRFINKNSKVHPKIG